ncbi:DedA family protein [Pseudonocardia spinosispora]|uniref:DedA family protein n=1 Tax=Pseudonocardia spinosispora TaxID=103441 RepID=UPI000402E1EB|nr:DedA family protein [Pseudonocardia spinosispora]
MSAVRDYLGGLPPLLLLLVLGLSVTFEVAVVVGVPLPGTTALLLLGFFARAGLVGLPSALGTAVLAGVAGTTAAFWSGRRNGTRVRSSRWGHWVGAAQWDRADQLFARFGRRAVFFGQFVAVARTLVPRLAGMNGQRYRHFAAASLPAITLWVPGFIVGGYLAGASYEAISSAFGSATTVLLVAVATAMLLILCGRWVARHPEPVHAAATALSATQPARAMSRIMSRRRGRWTAWLRRHTNARGALAVNLLVLTAAAITLAVLTQFSASWIAGHAGPRSIDVPVAEWLAAHQDYHLTGPALILVSVLRTSFVLIAAAALSLLAIRRALAVPHPIRSRTQRALSTIGGFAALAILAGVTDRLSVITDAPRVLEGGELFSTQTAVVTCAVALTAWRCGRAGGWTTRTALWTGAALIVSALAGARLYTGLALPSDTLAALLLGTGWALLLTNAAAHPTGRTSEPVERTTIPADAVAPSKSLAG